MVKYFILSRMSTEMSYDSSKFFNLFSRFFNISDYTSVLKLSKNLSKFVALDFPLPCLIRNSFSRALVSVMICIYVY